MRDHSRFRRKMVVITTINNDSFLGKVTWTTKDHFELENVFMLGDSERAPMPGYFTIPVSAVAWVQEDIEDIVGEGV